MSSCDYTQVYEMKCLNKPESCINQTINEVPMQEQEIINLICINQTPANSEHKINPQKTEYMVISFRQNINPINLKFNSESLNQVDNHKHLGVTISSNGKWAEHINNICQKATKQIFVLRKLKFILNRNNLNKIY